ncbi:hypothetical protein EYV94_20460 [Puteibacter caeruleilacunae]|nr:hypothetical protein EYV94_20460 [Puteibacter caeruleilacunae]
MSSNAPVVKQVAWISLIPQLSIMGLITLIWYQYDHELFILYGAVSYLIVSYILRTTIPLHQRKGMHKLKTGNFEVAIREFEKSYAFFKEHEWLDKYRFLILLNSSRISFKEMALNNIAYCYGQIGEGAKAKHYYERTLNEFPESGLAQAGLRMIKAIEEN